MRLLLGSFGTTRVSPDVPHLTPAAFTLTRFMYAVGCELMSRAPRTDTDPAPLKWHVLFVQFFARTVV
jgi:hypothetical protein